MDHLLECAEAFEQLLDVQYHIVLGRKNRLTELMSRGAQNVTELRAKRN